MLGKLIREVFGDKPRDYEGQKAVIEAGAEGQQRKLAGREDTKPEILYYLAGNGSPPVRRAVAANPATPRQADLLMAGDADEEVRTQIAMKIRRLLPDIGPGQAEKLRDLTLRTIETLVSDQLPRVRAALAEAIKHSPHIPKHIALQLAKDVEAEVSGPILEFSPLLGDADLREIIASGVASAALSAIARRKELSADVADAIVATIDVPAIASLLANPSAQVREETLDRIIETARSVEQLHRPLVYRPELSIRAIRRIAEFVSASLLERLGDRHSLPDALRSELKAKARSALEAEAPQDAGDEDAMGLALDRGDRAGIFATLAGAAKLSVPAVERIFQLKSARGIVALAWQAGLPMRLALRLQSEVAGIQPRDMVYARGGTDYPFPPEELEEQIAFFRAA